MFWNIRALLIAAIMASGCGANWKVQASKTLQIINDGALAANRGLASAVKESCIVIAKNCQRQGITEPAECPHYIKCITVLRSVKIATQGVLALSREAAAAIQAGEKDRVDSLMLKALEALGRLRADYLTIKAEVDKIIKKTPPTGGEVGWRSQCWQPSLA